MLRLRQRYVVGLRQRLRLADRPPYQKKADAELAKQREAEKAARSYDTLFADMDAGEDAPQKSVKEMEEDFM